MTDYAINVKNNTGQPFTFCFYASTPSLTSTVWVAKPVAGNGGKGALNFSTQWQVCQVTSEDLGSGTVWTSGSFQDVQLTGKTYTLDPASESQ